MDTVEIYKELRSAGLKVNSMLWEAVPDGPEGRRLILSAAKELGYPVSGRRMELPSVEAEDRLKEMVLHEPRSNGQSIARQFLESGPPLAPKERLVLEALASRPASLHEVLAIDPDKKQALLADLLDGEEEFWVTDLNFSATATRGMLLYARILHVKGISFASGASMGYPARSKEVVVKKLGDLSRLKNPHIRSRKRFALAVKLERTHGGRMLYQ